MKRKITAADIKPGAKFRVTMEIGNPMPILPDHFAVGVPGFSLYPHILSRKKILALVNGKPDANKP